jgi:hypothetical protein
MTREEYCYLAPAEFAALKVKDLRPKHDEMKSDTFSLGMTLLQAFSLTQVHRCYNQHSYQVSSEEINERLTAIFSRYDEQIIHVLNSMLVLAEGERLNAIQICEIIQQPFVPTQTPRQSTRGQV